MSLRLRLTLAVFAASLAVLYVLTANRFTLSYDEGIFIDGSLRVLAGQVPYRDFFILMGPGSFWLQAAVLKLFGVSFAVSHLVNIFDIALMTACICWLASGRVKWSLAVWTSAAFLLVAIADPGAAIPTHRWDSAAFATLAVTLLAESPGPIAGAIAGCAIAAAAWMTPPIGIVAPVVLPFLWNEHRRASWSFIAGAAVTGLAGVAVLTAQEAWPAIMQQMAWNREHYSGSNWVLYGSRVGGWGSFFGNIASPDWIVRASIGLALISPAIVPLAVTGRWLFKWRQLPALWIAGGWALLISTLPRFDSAHILYVSPVFFAMAAIQIAELQQRAAQIAIRVVTTIAMLAVGMFLTLDALQSFRIETAVGPVRAPKYERDLMLFLNAHVRQGDTLFVYPYKPILYFLTGTTNPTRYSYLQPGMMGPDDETRVLADLELAPPEHILVQEMHPDQILRVWPSTDMTRVRYTRLEDFFHTHYRVVSSLPPPDGGKSWMRLLQRSDYSMANSSPRPTTLGR